MTRRRLAFKPGLPASKQLNFIKLSDADGLKGFGCRRSQKPNLEVISVYIEFLGKKLN